MHSLTTVSLLPPRFVLSDVHISYIIPVAVWVCIARCAVCADGVDEENAAALDDHVNKRLE